MAIDDEPAQATQLFCTMIALAFVVDDMNVLLNHGVTAIDPQSRQHQIIADVREWHRQNPKDWRTTRQLLEEKYSQADGGMRDRNGYELTTGATIAAGPLYGEGDLAETLKTAFNFGWDADNSAATAGTIVGVLRGYRSLMSQGWQIVDRYRNTTRAGMPMDETITSFADRLIELAEKVVRKGGGERAFRRGRPVYRIAAENPGNVHPLRQVENESEKLRDDLKEEILAGIQANAHAQRRVAAAIWQSAWIWHQLWRKNILQSAQGSRRAEQLSATRRVPAFRSAGHGSTLATQGAGCQRGLSFSQ